jgi:type IV pilus assembly protein PilY1
MSASPIQLACQPNYAILTTDGYWNGNAGVKLNGNAMGDEDSTDAGYSKRSEARYDGRDASGTLADVALHYYKNDLRTDLNDQVPTSNRDTAAHQHMTTFTVGMGLAGQLSYDPAYESGTSEDFERLKKDPATGGLDWPLPAADTETALDDLWHAAVNGRGAFFSAKDPVELANGIAETLKAVSARVGAGAAAATSNLTPTAGDNFAFTPEFETVNWVGDLRARTIDLNTGDVATRELWSAASLLQQRDFKSRKIYTFDASDTTSGSGNNGNRLKAFCWPGSKALLDGDGNAAYPGCQGEAELSSAETDYFVPLANSPEAPLAQQASLNANGTAASATKEKLIDYLRGDTSNEMSGGTTANDLFRNRTSILGDIIDAQPAYVKASVFGFNTGNFTGRDPYYPEFIATTNGVNGTRKGTVFGAANDGMLHAFETDPDNNPYYQTRGISTPAITDDLFTGTLNTSPASGEGSERWAYMPSMLLPHLKRLADSPYTHRYFTDGSPAAGDVCFGHSIATPCSAVSNWRTILVGGLNSGGRGYYALDVSNPDAPKALWEFKGGADATCIAADADVDGTQTGDCNLGFSYGNPLIGKLPSDFQPSTHAGKWVVMVTSGYNNVSPGDGKGHLYIIEAQTGRLLKRYSTPAGSTTEPSGLGRINAWADNAFYDNTALTVYGADLKGNLWRIQFGAVVDSSNNTVIPANSVTRLATLTSDGSTPQPVTTKPELGEVSGKRVVFVATGKFIGLTDKSSVQRQSIYAIKDEMASATSPTVPISVSGSYPTRQITGFVRQDMVDSTVNPGVERQSQIASGQNPPDFTDSAIFGWFIDLPDGGTGGNGTERVTVDPVLQLGTLVVASNVPSADTCTAGGFGWVSNIDYRTGGTVLGATDGRISMKVASSLIVGINVVRLPGGVVKTIVTTADRQQDTKDTDVSPSTVTGRRVSWRELFVD